MGMAICFKCGPTALGALLPTRSAMMPHIGVKRVPFCSHFKFIYPQRRSSSSKASNLAMEGSCPHCVSCLLSC